MYWVDKKNNLSLCKVKFKENLGSRGSCKIIWYIFSIMAQDTGVYC